MKTAFIADGGVELGMGHVQQSITLAKELRDKTEICFLTTSDDTVIGKIRKADFSVFRVGNDSEMANVLQDMKPSMIVIDKLDVEEDFARDIKHNLKAKLVIFTNLTMANKYADIAVNAVINNQFKNCRFFDKKTNTLYFRGPKYWVLRDEFYQLKNKAKAVGNKVEGITLIFGGSDASNLTSAVLNELLGLNDDFEINVILGACFSHFDELNRVLGGHQNKRKKVRIHKNVENVAQLMYESDVVVASPGLSVFEALRVGTPVVVMHQNLWQKSEFKGFADTLGKNEVGKLRNIIDNGTFIHPHEEYIQRLDIGEGKPELLEAIIGG